MNFAIYLEDFDDPPIITFTISEEDYTETDTGSEYVGRDVYRGDIPLGGEAFTATTGNKYWIAMQMESDDGVFATGWESVVGDGAWEYSTFTGWTQDPVNEDCSYALYGEVTGVESASMGGVKALFK